jgi:hypothetical protein
MRRAFALFVIAITLTGCAQKPAFEELADGPCTSVQSRLIEEHISGQIDALAKKDWEAAYSFASADFQTAVGVEEFTFIIGAQYAMLVENQGYEFESCTIANSAIKQEVSVTSGDEVFGLNYRLSVVEAKLGVESAEVSKVDMPLTI